MAKKYMEISKILKNVTRIKQYCVCLAPAKLIVCHRWRRFFGTKLNLRCPKTYNEKIQWLKIYGEKRALFGDIDLAKQCSDKFSVRKYVGERIGESYLNTLYAVFPNVKSIELHRLPVKFVLKATHDSGSVVFVNDKERINNIELEKISEKFKMDYGRFSKEWVYKGIKPKIIVEKYLDCYPEEPLYDYKVFCFHGEPKIIQVDLDRFSNHTRNIYDTSWNLINLGILYPQSKKIIEKPILLQKILDFSAILSKPFCHVRVDWMISKKELVFGEMTFFHGSGYEPFTDETWNYKMGEWLSL